MVTVLDRDRHDRTGYRRGCRCRRCTADMREQARADWAVRRMRRGAEPAFRVPTAPVVAHLDFLASRGVHAAEVARRAQVAPATLTRARRAGRMSNLTARALLAVRP